MGMLLQIITALLKFFVVNGCDADAGFAEESSTALYCNLDDIISLLLELPCLLVDGV